ncbi:MAG TPA: superoxide dismutase family protein [Myxococcaceae bacterium]|nr:superoxide dismutase family protein [Myxococcaceae bacterium]
MLALLGLSLPLLANARAAPSEPATQPPGTLTVAIRDLRGRSVGQITLTDSPHGLLLRGKLKNLPKGVHALHFHETGKCEAPFKTAGGHYNPTQRSHGVLDPGGLHAGDLPNLVVPRSGKVDFETFAPALTLSPGPTTVLDADGSALVLHAKADDHHTQPSGDAGDRIACAVIVR